MEIYKLIKSDKIPVTPISIVKRKVLEESMKMEIGDMINVPYSQIQTDRKVIMEKHPKWKISLKHTSKEDGDKRISSLIRVY